MTETKRGGTGMREALEKIRELATPPDKPSPAARLDAIYDTACAALSSTGGERREAIEAAALKCLEMARRAQSIEAHGALSLAADAIRSLLHADGGEKP